MKIICVGRNYVAHARELKNEVPKEPVIFCKPDSSLLKGGKPFLYPDYSDNIHYEAELVVKICKNGRHVNPKFAHNYFNEISVGLDLTARDIQTRLKEKGLPWELSKSFDNSAVIGDFIPLSILDNPDNIRFNLHKNGEEVQTGESDLMIFSIADLISFISRYFFLRMGDLIFTGTPAGVGPIAIGDHFSGQIEGMELLNMRVK